VVHHYYRWANKSLT